MSNAPGASSKPPRRINGTVLLSSILAIVLSLGILITFIVFFEKNANDWRPVPTHTPTLNPTQGAEATKFAGSVTPVPIKVQTQAATQAAAAGASTAAATGAATQAAPTQAATAAATSPATRVVQELSGS
jgi:hypothetical protein